MAAYIKFPNFFLLKDEYLDQTLKTLSSLINRKKDIYSLDVSEIENMRVGDYMVLAAQIEKSMLYGNKFVRTSTLPHSKKIRLMFGQSKKVVHINVQNTTEFERAQLLYPVIVDSIVKELKKIGIKEYFFPFNTFLTELIGNAVEHGIKDKNINWWLHHEIDNRTRTITFTFVDMGKGIVDSHKEAGLPFKYRFLNHSKIVLDAFYGKLGSSTKLKNRGRGLPQVRDMIEKEYVSNLVLITNTVSLHFKNNVFISTKNHNFRGTYYCWTINLNNFQKWKNSKLT